MSNSLMYLVVSGTFALLQGVAITIIAGIFSRENKKRNADAAKIERRAAIRAEESQLAMRLMSANTSLAVATGLALKEGLTNGKMDVALVEAAKAQGDYFKFINDVAAKQMVGE